MQDPVTGAPTCSDCGKAWTHTKECVQRIHGCANGVHQEDQTIGSVRLGGAATVWAKVCRRCRTLYVPLPD